MIPLATLPPGVPNAEDVRGYGSLNAQAVLFFVLIVFIVVGACIIRAASKWGSKLFAALEEQTKATTDLGLKQVQAITLHTATLDELKDNVRDWHNRLSAVTSCPATNCPAADLSPPLRPWERTPKPGELTREGLALARAGVGASAGA